MNDTKNGDKTAEEIIDEFSGKSDDELTETLIRTIAEQKKNGTFDRDAARNFMQMISPMLNDEQRQRLMCVLSAIGADV